MYGYIVPQKSTMSASDFVLYRSFYCGVCCETGRMYGQLPRFTTNYDFAFLSALLHDYGQANVVIEERPCVLNPKKKAILQSNELLKRIAAANIILCYQKADDGVVDGDGLKYRALRRMLRKPCKLAQSICPEVWERVKRSVKEQSAVEKSKTSSIDRAADPFASLMRDLPELILGVQTDDNLKSLCYNVGKFVYLADALDDLVDDRKHKRYNPFLLSMGEFKNRACFIKANREQLEFIFNGICGRAEECFSRMRFTQSYSLIRNIVFGGMRSKAKELLDSTKKLKPPRI